MASAKLIGMCVVVALGVGALASSAQAAEVGECLKLEKVEGVYHGHYVDKNCLTAATPLQEAEGKHNEWEWSPGLAPANRPFTGKTKAVELIGAAGSIECRKSATAGEWTGPKTSVQTTTYEGCEFKGGPVNECHSAGQGPGVIVTNALVGTLIGHGETGPSRGEPATSEAWDSLVSAETSGIQMEYLCAELVLIRTLGSVAGVFTPASVGVRTKTGLIEFNGVLGEEPGKFGEQDLFSEASIGGGPFEPAGQGVEKTTNKFKAAHQIEIRP